VNADRQVDRFSRGQVRFKRGVVCGDAGVLIGHLGEGANASGGVQFTDGGWRWSVRVEFEAERRDHLAGRVLQPALHTRRGATEQGDDVAPLQGRDRLLS